MASIRFQRPVWLRKFLAGALFVLLLACLASLLPTLSTPQSVLLLDVAASWEPGSIDEGRIQAIAVGSAGQLSILPASVGVQRHRLPITEDRTNSPTRRTQAWSFELGTGQLNSASRSLITQADSDQPVSAVLFPQIFAGGDFFLNGTWIAGLPVDTSAASQVWMQPLVVPLPPKLLRTDSRPNVLTLVQTTYDNSSRMWPIMIGDIADIDRIHQAMLLLSRGQTSALDWLCMFCGLLLASAWMASPKDHYFAWAGISCALWALQMAVLPWLWRPGIRELMYVLDGSETLSLFMLIRTFIGRPVSWHRYALFLCLSAAGPLVYLLAGWPAVRWLDGWWVGALHACGFYLAFKLALHAWRTRSGDTAGFAMVVLVSILTGLRDESILTGSLAHVTPVAAHWSYALLLFQPIPIGHLILPLQLVMIVYKLLNQHRLYARSMLNANAELQRALDKQAAELEKSHEHRRRLTKAEAVQFERERIYQDIHDGIGSRLVSTLFAIRRGQVSHQEVENSLQSCIGDLRMVINAQQDRGDDIQSAVFDYCMTLEAQLDGTGLELLYEVSDGPSLTLLPRVHLNVFRILQESVTNAIKHSGAKQLFIKLGQSDTGIALTVRDNGHGIPEHVMQQKTDTSGRGLTGFKNRAETIGGLCFIRPDHPGTRVDLVVPLVFANPDLSFAPPSPWLDSTPLALAE